MIECGCYDSTELWIVYPVAFIPCILDCLLIQIDGVAFFTACIIQILLQIVWIIYEVIQLVCWQFRQILVIAQSSFFFMLTDTVVTARYPVVWIILHTL